jgi:hypothetical protein
MWHLALDHGAHGCVAIVRHTPEVDAHRYGVCLRQKGELGPRRHVDAPVREELVSEPDAAEVDDLPSPIGAKHPDVRVPAGDEVASEPAIMPSSSLSDVVATMTSS